MAGGASKVSPYSCSVGSTIHIQQGDLKNIFKLQKSADDDHYLANDFCQETEARAVNNNEH